MESGALGKTYREGEPIVREDDPGNCMYVIQSGEVEVVKEANGVEVRLAVLGQGDFFGEMSIFENEPRSATVRPLGPARVLTVDKRTLLGRIGEDPSLAFRLVERMAHRIRRLDAEVARLQGRDCRT